MSTQVKLRRGTTSNHAAFTGSQAELTYDTDLKTGRFHDGATAGGFVLATRDWVALQIIAGVADGSITPVKFANISQNQMLGRIVAGSGAPAWLSQSEARQAIGLTTIGSGVGTAATTAAALLAAGVPQNIHFGWMFCR